VTDLNEVPDNILNKKEKMKLLEAAFRLFTGKT
jgi:hypothetical protein